MTTPDKTILFIHGGPLGGWMWEQVIAQMPDYTCLAPDLPEHGSPPADGTYSLDAAVAALAARIRRDGLAPVHVVGVSMGGQVGLEVLRQHPDLTASAVLVSASMGPLPGGGLISALSRPMVWLSTRGFALRQAARMLGLPDALRARYDDAMRSLTPGLFRRINDSIHHYRLPADLSAITQPVLVVCGANEPGFVKRNQRELAAHLPNAEGRMVAGGGHGWCMEQPAQFADLLRGWIENKSLPDDLLPLA